MFRDAHEGGGLELAAESIRDLFRGRETLKAEVGALMVAEFLALVRRALTG